RIQELRAELEELGQQSDLTDEQTRRLAEVIGEITRLAPEAAQGFDTQRQAVTNLQLALEGLDAAYVRVMQRSREFAERAALVAQGNIPDLEQRLADIRRQTNLVTEALRQGRPLSEQLLRQMQVEATEMAQA